VAAHASYLLSFKPLHTNSSAPAPPKTSCAGRYNALDSIQPGAGASSPVLLEARPSRPHRPHQSDSLPHTLTTRTTPALHSPSLLLDRRLRPVSVEPLHCDPLSSSKYPPLLSSLLPTNAVLEPRLTSQRNHVRLRRCCRLGIPDAVALLQGMLLSGARSSVCQ
jgi:hypothetical protein